MLDIFSDNGDDLPPKVVPQTSTATNTVKPTPTTPEKVENVNTPPKHPGELPKVAAVNEVDPLAESGEDDMTRPLADRLRSGRRPQTEADDDCLAAGPLGHSSTVSRIVGSRISSVAKASAMRVKKHGSQPAPLLNAVVAYGETVQFLTPEPTDDPYQADSAGGGFADEGQMPRVTFAAVNQAADKFLPYRRKGYEMLVVIVGNNFSRDWDQFDAAVPKLRRQEVTVLGIGQGIPFYRQWHADDRPNAVNKVPDSLPLESLGLEGIDLGLPGGQTDVDLTDSGYGPFGLERLCRATQGASIACGPAT